MISKAYQKRTLPKEPQIAENFDAFIFGMAGRVKSLYPYKKHLTTQAQKIYDLSLTLKDLDEKAFDKKLIEVKNSTRLGKLYKDELLLNEALALICEASYRVLEIRPYSVQIMGALALFKNFIIQMHTGEGKTITAVLGGILYGWLGKPCHIVTSNDYLAKRDAINMRKLYERCYLDVGYIVPDMEDESRKENYNCAIVYSTSNDILADFLRDQMASEDAINYDKFLINKIRKKSDNPQVMRGIYSVIIDEADSVLADDATTPLIISVPRENKPLKEAIEASRSIATKLQPKIDYTISDAHQEIYFTAKGEESIDTLSAHLPAIWQSRNRREYLLRQAITAKEFYKKDTKYVVLDEKIVIVDEKTGRLMPSRSWGGGLHQAVEAKEGLELTDPTQTHIKMSFQRFFRLYKNISGMSGTLQNLENELWHIYGLSTLKIPKRVSNNYKIFPEKIFLTKEQKWKAVLEEIESMHQLGRPILVGTRNIIDSEIVSSQLTSLGLENTILHALHHKEEADIIAQAGEEKQITIATNIAGRGTDISLSKLSIELGGLHVIATERHNSKRVDMQLFGRSARQGQAGSVQAILSLEDDIIIQKCPKFLAKQLAKIVHTSIGKRISLLVYILIQALTDRSASKMRKTILANDFSMSKRLSFSEK